MAKKSESTPRSRVRAAIRGCWLRSKERATALKNANYTCECCGVKQSKAKGKEVSVEVHHNNADGGTIPWDKIIDYVFKHILVDPKHLTVLCKKCHKEEHIT